MKSYIKVIAHAVLSKFNDLPIESLVSEIEQIDKILADPNPSASAFERDIRAQLECFRSIESRWSNLELSFELITKIHAVCTGSDSTRLRFRRESFVTDFGGYPPTPPIEIEARIAEIESACDHLNRFNYSTHTTNELAALLSELFCIMIAVHPFSDGNGRTARFTIQLGLRRNNCDYIIIPKYRNSVEWKIALEKGLDGDLGPMKKYFQERISIRKAPQNESEI